MLSALLPRKQANQTKPGGGRKLLQGDQALRYKSPIQNQENCKSQENRNSDQNFPVLFIPSHGEILRSLAANPTPLPRLSQRPRRLVLKVV
jgi:hypothetical protein